MKIALLLNANVFYSPYIKIYSKILDELKVEYDILAWDRVNTGEKEGVIYKKYYPYETRNRIKWIIYYFAYSMFLKKQIRRNKYDRLIVFGPQIGLFLFTFLKSRYKQRFCFDYRDIFIEQMFPRLFKRFLSISSLNAISSDGFREYLPKAFEYILCHNFDIDIVNSSVGRASQYLIFKNKPIKIMTIGTIRNYEQNLEFIKELANNPDYLIKFIGYPGGAGQKLQHDSIVNNINNVEFIGYYEKKDEPSLINDTDFLNIYYSPIVANKTAMTNTFYYALIYKKPLIVLNDSIQGMYVKKYKLGILIENCSNLNEQIQEFVANFNVQEFTQNCDKLLIEFRKDYYYFKNRFSDFLNCN